jgi:8-amino-7-oxononanoate synthase
MNLERNNIIKNSQLLRSELNKNGYSTKNSNSHIIPVLLPDDSSTMKLASVLQEKGFDIRGVRPPTVKEPRLRIIINSKINQNDILQLIHAFNIY